MSIKKIFCSVIGVLAAEGVALLTSSYFTAITIAILAALTALACYVYETSKKQPKQILR